MVVLSVEIGEPAHPFPTSWQALCLPSRSERDASGTGVAGESSPHAASVLARDGRARRLPGRDTGRGAYFETVARLAMRPWARASPIEMTSPVIVAQAWAPIGICAGSSFAH